MKPIDGGEAWWPKDLGSPSTSGSQNDMRYAYFAGKHRLVIEEDGETTAYDTGDHDISGVSQQDSQGRSLTFTSGKGKVDLSSLKKLD